MHTRIWLALTLAVCAAAASPFDGTWVRDASRSDPVGGRIGGPGRPVAQVTLAIEDRSGEFEVRRRVSFGQGEAPELVQRFRLDGKESVNPAPAPGGRRGEVRSKARREGARIVVEGRQQLAAISGGIYVQTTDLYEVSKDGTTLTVTTTRTNRENSDTVHQVYRKESR